MLYNLLLELRETLESARLWPYVQFMRYAEFRMLCAMGLAFAMVTLLGRRTILWLVRQKIGDNPEFHNADLNRMTRQKANTPTMGGILIAGAILVATLLLADLKSFYVQMAIICLLWMAALGAADDWLKLTGAHRNPGSRQGLYSWEKMTFQVAIALLLGWLTWRHGINNEQAHVLSLPFQRTINPRTLSLNESVLVLGGVEFVLLAIIVIVGSSNAVNLTDGMDGLASGIMGIVSFAFLILCLIAGTQDLSTFLLMPYVPGSVELGIIAGAMVGACLGFLWWNCHPAHVFMGDTGSLCLGGLAGFIAVVIRQELLLFVIGGVLVAEVMSVILQVGYFKLTKGQRLFRCAPIHHHFHLMGWTEPQVVVRFWLVTAMLAVLALASLRLR